MKDFGTYQVKEGEDIIFERKICFILNTKKIETIHRWLQY